VQARLARAKGLQRALRAGEEEEDAEEAVGEEGLPVSPPAAAAASALSRGGEGADRQVGAGRWQREPGEAAFGGRDMLSRRKLAPARAEEEGEEEEEGGEEGSCLSPAMAATRAAATQTVALAAVALAAPAALRGAMAMMPTGCREGAADEAEEVVGWAEGGRAEARRRQLLAPGRS